MTIQRTYRGFNKKLIFDVLIAHVITVQSVARRWIINMRLCQVRQIHGAATTIQTMYRGFIVRINYIFTVLEIVLCQSIVRRNIARMRYRREMAVVATLKTKIKIEHAAATKVQITYRVFTARRNIIFSRNRAKVIAAITIQMTYRGVKERQKIYKEFLRRDMSTVTTTQKTYREFNKRQINRLHSMTDEDQLVTFTNEHVTEVSDGTCNVNREIIALVGVVIPDESDNVDELLYYFKGREISLRDTLRGIYARDILGSITSDVTHAADDTDTSKSIDFTISSCDDFDVTDDLNVYPGDDDIKTLSIHSALHHSSSQGMNIEDEFFARTSISSIPSTNTTSLTLHQSRWKKKLVICIVAASPVFVVCIVIVGLYINSRASGDSAADNVGFANTAPTPTPVIVQTTVPSIFPSKIIDTILMPTNPSVGNVTTTPTTVSNNSLTPTIPLQIIETSIPNLSIEPFPSASLCYSIIISILYDASPFGSGFVIRRTNTAAATYSFFPSDDSLAFQYYNESICLEQGRYSFTMYDKNGNGICCGLNGSNGVYFVSSNGIVLVEGGEFAYEEETLFDLPATLTT